MKLASVQGRNLSQIKVSKSLTPFFRKECYKYYLFLNILRRGEWGKGFSQDTIHERNNIMEVGKACWHKFVTPVLQYIDKLYSQLYRQKLSGCVVDEAWVAWFSKIRL